MDQLEMITDNKCADLICTSLLFAISAEILVRSLANFY